LAGIVYQKFGNKLYAVAGEIIGTGILGGLLAFPIAKLLLGKDIAAFYFIIPFLISTIGGSIIGYAILILLERNYILRKFDV